METVLVGLSGGVDSATTAALLIDSGYKVIGVTLSMWQAGMVGCGGENEESERYEDARRVADHLKIPWRIIDQKIDFKNNVLRYYIDSLTQGLTPNPCIVCNKTIKWQMLLKTADDLGATYVATGHYARSHNNAIAVLSKAKDKNKDQSYFLSILGQKELTRTIFPLGDYTKVEVRQIAQKKKIPVASRIESQDLCFFGGLDQDKFIRTYAPGLMTEGDIVNTQGEFIGKHRGLALYTIGQRKGIMIPATSALYVIQKDIRNNRLVVGEKQILGKASLVAGAVNWISGNAPGNKFHAKIKIRYRSPDKECTIITRQDGKIEAHLDEPLRDITPGQAVVMYQGEICLGMGFIE